MSDQQSALRDAIAAVHEDVPHRFQVSLTMSMDVRDDIRAIRDELKDVAEETDVTTNDVMRLALITAAQCHERGDDASTNDRALDEEQLQLFASLINRAVAAENTGTGDVQ